MAGLGILCVPSFLLLFQEHHGQFMFMLDSTLTD